MSWREDFKKILAALLGLALCLSGGFFLYLEMSGTDRHPEHVYVFAAMMAVGCLIVAPSTIGAALKQLASILPSIKIGKSGSE
jgi:hypothetical protein